MAGHRSRKIMGLFVLLAAVLLTAQPVQADSARQLPDAARPAAGDVAPQAALEGAISWNICGNLGNEHCERRGVTPDELVDRMVRMAQEENAKYIFLQEVCRDTHYDPLVKALDGEWVGRFRTAQDIDAPGNPILCRDEDPDDGRTNPGGVAVFLKPEPGSSVIPSDLRFPPPPGYQESQGAACLIEFVVGVDNYACSVHLPDNSQPRYQEFRQAGADFMAGRLATAHSADLRMVIGGDFNAPPTAAELATLAAVATNTTPNEPTTEGGAMLDRIYINAHGWSVVDGSVDLGIPDSDHWPVRATLTPR